MVRYYQMNAYKELSTKKLLEMRREQLKIIDDAKLDIIIARDELEIIYQRLFEKKKL